MLQVILRLLGVVFLAIGAIMVYDARILTNKWFGFGDQNEASTGMKILGGLICIIGAIIVYFNR